MALDTLLNRKQSNSVTSVTSCNVGDVTPKPLCIKDVTLVTSVTSQNINSQIEIIENWLFKIGEPESDHHLVIEKCKNDPEALAFFLKHAHGEFEHGCRSANASKADDRHVDDRVRCGDCLYLSNGYCQQWKKTNPHNQRYRPVRDVLRRCGAFQPKLDGISNGFIER